MRSLRKSWIGIVLIFFFGISLFFWKQSTVVSNIFNSDNIVANVGNTKVSTTRFNRGLQLNINNFNEILGKQLTSEEIKNYQIHQLALGAIINETVFENEFNNLDFKLDEKIIAKKTKELIPQLYNNNNELNEEFLKEFLSQQKLKIDDIVQILHYDARNEYFNSAFLKINLPKTYSKKINIYKNHSRDIEYLNIPVGNISIQKFLKENENNIDSILKEHYDKNLSDYMTEEKRDIKYILLNKKEYLKNFIPTNNEVQEYYNQNSELFTLNEKRSFLQFNFKTINNAEVFIRNTENLLKYEEIINYANDNSIEFNTFKSLGKDELLEEIANTLFMLNTNEISNIITSPIGFHIIVLQNIEESKTLDFNEAKEKIIEEISNIDVNNFLLNLEGEISEDIVNGLSLEEISSKHNLNLSKINNFTTKLNNFNNEDKSFYESIRSNAFIAELNYTNDIINLNENEFYTYEVKKIVKPKPIDISKIKEKILEDWIKFKKIDKFLEEIDRNIKNINYINELESKYSSKIQYLLINVNSKNLPQKLKNYILQSNVKDINYIIEDDVIHVSKLIKVNMESKEIEEENQLSLNEEIRKALYNELLKNTKITTNDKLIDAIINSY